MKNLNLPFIGSLVTFTIIIICLYADLGEIRPAYTVDWTLIFTGVVVMGGFWLLGYWTKKEKSNTL